MLAKVCSPAGQCRQSQFARGQEIDSQILQHGEGDPFTFPQEPKQKVGRCHRWIVCCISIHGCKLNRAAGSWGQDELIGGWPAALYAALNDLIRLVPNLLGCYTQAVENASRDLVAIRHQGEQDMFGADVLVTEPPRFANGLSHHGGRSRSEFETRIREPYRLSRRPEPIAQPLKHGMPA